MTIANDPEFYRAMAADPEAREAMRRLIAVMHKHRYAYNFSWLGRPIIQLPQDILAIQEILWTVRPGLVVETGIAHGGSLILSASILELLGGSGRVIGIDIDIREHNRKAIEAHPLARRIDMIEGSSIDPAVVAEVHRRAEGRGPVVVMLDSMHTHDHVLGELRAYAPLVGRGGYVVVLDTLIEDQGPGDFPDRPWGPGNSPKTAVHAFLEESGRFEIDRDLEARLLVTVAPDGFLRCVKDPA